MPCNNVASHSAFDGVCAFVLFAVCESVSSSQPRTAIIGAADDYVSRNTPHMAAMRARAGMDGNTSYDPCISRQVGGRAHLRINSLSRWDTQWFI